MTLQAYLTNLLIFCPSLMDMLLPFDYFENGASIKPMFTAKFSNIGNVLINRSIRCKQVDRSSPRFYSQLAFTRVNSCPTLMVKILAAIHPEHTINIQIMLSAKGCQIDDRSINYSI